MHKKYRKDVGEALPYRSFNHELRSKFSERVHKISVNTYLSCPNRDGTKGTEGCIFCSPENLVKKSHLQTASVTEQIISGRKYVEKRFGAKKFIAYFQHYTNTYASPDVLYRMYSDALDTDGVVGLAISTRPDCVTDEILDMIGELAKKSYVWLEYGLQSANDKTLELIGRKHTVRDFTEAVEKTLLHANINVLAHIILGLPGESQSDVLKTVDLITSMGIHGIKMHHLYVVKGTRLYEEYMHGKISILSLDEYIETLFSVLVRLPPEMVVHRLFGEAPLNLLVAPRWDITKNELMRKIAHDMREKGLFQGKYINSC